MPTASVEFVTPEMAAELLDQNDANRPLNLTRVAHYVRLIQNGEWQLTGDAICVAPGGRLLNGQHRLSAIAETGAEQPMVILRDCPEESFSAMDAGMSRSISVHFRKMGSTSPGPASAVSKLLWHYLEDDAAPGSLKSARKPTAAEAWRVFDAYRSEIGQALETAASIRKVYGGAPAALAIALTVIEHGEDALPFWWRVDPEFEDGLAKGHPSRTLRDHMLLNPYAKQMRGEEFVARAFQAFNAWAMGETLAASTYAYKAVPIVQTLTPARWSA